MNRTLVYIATTLALVLAIASAALSAAFKIAAVACVAVLFLIGLWVLTRGFRRRP